MIDQNTVQKIAHLARLRLSEAEVKQYTQQLGDILNYVEKLSELNTENVEAMSHAVETPTPMRQDQVEKSEVIKEVLNNAPAAEGPFFQVPKVI